MKSKLMLSVLGAFLALSLCSCATTSGGGIDPDKGKKLAKAAVQIFVVETVEGNPGKAQRVANDAHAIKALLGTDGFNTVDLIMVAVRAKLDLSGMQPAKQIIIGMALDEVAGYLKSVVGDGTIPVDKIPLVAEVAGWVEDAANLVIPPVVIPPPPPVIPSP